MIITSILIKNSNPGKWIVFRCRPKLSVTRKYSVRKNNDHSTVVNRPWTTERWDQLSNPAGKTCPLQLGDTYWDLPVITTCLAKLYTKRKQWANELSLHSIQHLELHMKTTNVTVTGVINLEWKPFCATLNILTQLTVPCSAITRA